MPSSIENTYTFGLKQAVVAKRNIDGSYGTLRNVDSIRSITIQEVVQTADLEGRDKILVSNTRIIKGDVSLEFAGYNASDYEIILSMKTGSHDYGAYEIEKSSRRTEFIQPFGLVGQTEDEFGNKVHIFVPYLLMMDAGSANAVYGEFWRRTVRCSALADSVYADPDGEAPIFMILKNASVSTMTLPPVGWDIPVS